MSNLFTKLYAENMRNVQQPNAKLYGGIEVTESEVMQSYAECISAQMAIDTEMCLIASAADTVAEKHGAVYALYGEAEGGFFKKILDALIKVYNKAKDFVVKLLGRFKSDKKYRENMTYLASVAKSLAGVTFTENASITVKKAKYPAVAAIVAAVMRKNSILLNVGKKEGKNINLEDVNKKLKEVLSNFKDGGDKIDEVKTILTNLQTEYSTKDAWLKDKYFEATSAIESNMKGTGEADFSKTSAGTAMEQVGKLWDTSTKVLKGNKEMQDFIDVMKAIFALTDKAVSVDYDSIADALEKGVTEMSDKLEDLKELQKEVSTEATRIQSSNKDDDKDSKDVAGKAAGMGMAYSNVMSNYTIVITEGFNTAKIQLDRLLADFLAYAKKLEDLRKTSSNKIQN